MKKVNTVSFFNLTQDTYLRLSECNEVDFSLNALTFGPLIKGVSPHPVANTHVVLNYILLIPTVPYTLDNYK